MRAWTDACGAGQQLGAVNAEGRKRCELASPHSTHSSPSSVHDMFTEDGGISSLSTDILLHVASHAKSPTNNGGE